ncbi:MAG: CoA pyrophosphatase [Clostridium sp.]
MQSERGKNDRIEKDNRLDIANIKEKWHNKIPGRIDGERYKDAAVLVPIMEKKGELHLLLEIRTDTLKTQPGEICFPGGTIESLESPREAAMRETREELLVQETQLEVLAQLDLLITPSGMIIYPFLAELKNYEGTFSKDEVGEMITIPLSYFVKHPPERYSTKVVTVPDADFPYDRIPGGEDYKWRQGRYDVLFYRYGEHVIWGMTAKILHSFISHL